ncbi:MAG: thiamine diphosphokinase [Eubacterium sp.]|nr:thiamine diphosphokinase [Eubacterium sp.]
MKNRCVIVGSMNVDSRIQDYLEDSFVIAADGGLLNLEKSNKTPDLILGDFDSLGFEPEGENVIKYPVKKNDTDMMLAVKKAIDLGYKEIVIFGGCGGRLDHTLANINTMVYALEKGANISILDSQNDMYITDDSLRQSRRDKDNISLFAIEEKAVVDIEGAKYSGKNIVISNNTTLGVSNSFADDEVKISVVEGTILVIVSNE